MGVTASIASLRVATVAGRDGARKGDDGKSGPHVWIDLEQRQCG
jgi:hypothetical protein